MKEHLKTLIRASSPLQARNQAREYLQALTLQALQRTGAMTAIAFHGGTALRFLYSLSRYSEDLDFTLETPSDSYDFRSYLYAIQRDLNAQGYQTALKVSDRKTVQSAFVRFPGLLHELKLSPHRDEVLAVRIEIDTNPPRGVSLDTSLVRRHILLHLQHHDRQSLLAGKLHALLQRPFAKGRDLYDLIWYLSDRDWPEPNLTLLNNALTQTGWTGPEIKPENWRAIVREIIEGLPFEQALDDVRPFLAPEEDPDFLTRERLLRLLG